MRHIIFKALLLFTIVSCSLGKKEDTAKPLTDKERKLWEFKQMNKQKYAAILEAAQNDEEEIEQDEVDQTYVLMEKDKESVRAGTSNTDFRWPYKMAIQIDPKYDAKQTETIMASIETLDKAMNCFKFSIIPKGTKIKETDDYLFIRKDGKGCHSKLGRRGGKQETVVSEGCMPKLYGTTVHEIMHVLGFYHEHVRPDRDNWVEIDDASIDDDSKKLQYQIRPEQTAFDKDYDFESIMHYNLNKILKPKKALTGINYKVGQRDHLSAKDISRLNKMYPCKKEKGKLVPELAWKLPAKPKSKKT